MPESSSFPDMPALAEDILSALPYPVVGIDRSGIVRLCNGAMLDLIPCEKQDFLGMHIQDAFSGSSLLDVVRSGQHEKWRKLTLDNGSYFVNRSPLKVAGEIIGAIASLHDATDLDNMAHELGSVSVLAEELEGIFRSALDGIFVTDAKGVILRVNESYCRITGLERSELIGKSMYDLVALGVFDKSTSIHVLETGEPVTLIQKISNGATVMVSGNPLRDPEGNISRVVTTVHDLTELNRIRDDLTAMETINSRYEQEIHNLKKNVPDSTGFITQSDSMRAISELCLRLGLVDTTVLIQGESGVGKEVVAELIHRSSLRAEQPFIKINCTAIPDQLLESELFGYVRGAFTGASTQGKMGLFEAANGGTLLLDEIGDMALGLQAKLLRVIQNRKTRRIGDNVERDIDVRILVATNRDLFEMVKQRLFREDLFYRINVVPVVVPPLRQRREDILPLAYSSLKKFSERHGRPMEFHPSILPQLMDYLWPGNVRELENVVERLVVTSKNPVITLEDIPPFMFLESASPSFFLSIEGKSLRRILDELEAKVVGDALARYGTTRKAAEALDIDQSNIVRKARKFGLSAIDK